MEFNYRNVSEKVKEKVKEILPYGVTLEQVIHASNHPNDACLYHVLAKRNNRYIVWNCYNETTNSLNFEYNNLLYHEAMLIFWNVKDN